MQKICTSSKGPMIFTLSFYGGVFLAQIGTHYRGEWGHHKNALRTTSDPLKMAKNGNDPGPHWVFWACPEDILEAEEAALYSCFSQKVVLGAKVPIFRSVKNGS